jgi:hypothetical protein
MLAAHLPQCACMHILMYHLQGAQCMRHEGGINLNVFSTITTAFYLH